MLSVSGVVAQAYKRTQDTEYIMQVIKNLKFLMLNLNRKNKRIQDSISKHDRWSPVVFCCDIL